MVRKALFWSYAAQFSIFAITFGGSVVVARLLSPHELGIYALAMATLGFIQIFTAFNIGTFLIREVELTPRTIDTAFTVNALLSIVLSLVLLALGELGGRVFSDPAVARVIQLLAILPVLSIFSFRQSSMLQRAMLFRGAAIIAFVGAVVSTAVTVAAAYTGYSYMSPAYGAVAGALVSLIGFFIIGREHFAGGLSLSEWRRMTEFGLRLISIGGVTTASGRMGEIVIGKMLGLEALGLFNRAGNLNNLITQNIYGTATRVVFARLSEAARQGPDAVGPVFLRGFRLITAIMGPLLMGIAVLAQPLIVMLYGAKWTAAGPLLALAVSSQFISLSFAMNWELFVVRDEMKLQTRLEMSRALFALVLVALASTISLTAVAWTGIVYALASTVIYTRLMPRLAGVQWPAIFGMYRETLVVTGAAIVPAAAMMTWYGWANVVPVGAIAGAVLIGGLLWLGTLIALRHPLIDEMRLVLNKLHGHPAAARSAT